MRRRLDDEEQAIFVMSLAGIGRLEIAKTLRISQSGLQSRLSEMVRKLETMDMGNPTSPAPVEERSGVRARRFVTDLPAH